MSDNLYDLNVVMKEILKAHGGQQFFRELNAARIPFFFAAAVVNTEKETEYYCEAITPGSMGLKLADDKFADFLDIRNEGFVAVPSTDLTSEGAQALKMLNETRKEGTFYGNALADFSRANGIEIIEHDDLDDEEAPPQHGQADELIGSILQYTIADGQGGGKEGEFIVPTITPENDYSNVKFCVEDDSPHVFGENFAEIDERHKNIKKGSGAFMRAKEREAASGLTASHVPADKDGEEED